MLAREGRRASRKRSCARALLVKPSLHQPPRIPHVYTPSMDTKRKNIRLPNWNYATKACYHVTICTHNRKTFFATVSHTPIDGYRTELTHMGSLCRDAIELAAQEYNLVNVANYVIMPNHVHLLIEIHDDDSNTLLGRFVGFLKSKTTRMIRENGHPGMTIWQRGYYDHIIRDEDDYHRTWEYINNNPARWGEDKYFVR